MTHPIHKELEALMSLLEDPDSQVFDTVSGRLIELGEEVVVPLEKRWEITLRPDLQVRIENVIKKIHFNSLMRDMDSWRSSGGNDLLYGAYLVARFQYPDLEYEPLNAMVDKISRDIWLELNNNLTALEKVKVINYFLYDIHKFDKSLKKAHTPQLYFINHVLDTHKGSPVLLGLIYAELARRLNLPIYGVNLPRNFVLCFYDQDFPDDPNGILFYINPSDSGAVLGLKELKHFLRQLKIEEKDF
ncbi:MAG: transglutaminase family protein, partial [Bacteroidales bacterium]|nr:transglutaminase family protein [Bacteroidales bacterium]